MSPSARRAVLVIAILAAVAGGAWFYRYRSAGSVKQGPVPDLFLTAPPNAPLVIYLDLESLRAWPHFASLARASTQISQDPEYAEFVRRTGFDYTRDLDRAILAVFPANPNPQFAAVAEGRFDRQKILAGARRESPTKNGPDIFLLPGSNPARPLAVAFLTDKRLALADAAVIGSVLSVPSGHALDSTTEEAVSRVSGSAVFALGRAGVIPPDFAPGGVRSDQLTALLRSLEWFTLAARPNDDAVIFAAEGESDSAENARQLSGALDFFRQLLIVGLSDPRVHQSMRPEQSLALEKLLRAAVITNERGHDRRVRVILEVPLATLDTLAPTPQHP